MATTTAPVPAGVRGELARAALTALLALGLLLPFVLRDGTPRAPRLTVFGGEDGLSLLLEGAGGGRVLLGGGGAQTEIGAQLGRRLRPWDRRLDLLLVADARDLPGAVDLVRHGDVRRVATLGLEGARAGGSALAALRDACAARGIPLEAIDAAERIRVGRAADNASGAALTLDVQPAPEEGAGAALRLVAGGFAATIVGGGGTVPEPAPAAILLRGGQEGYRAALAARPGLLIAAAPPSAATTRDAPPARHLLVVGPGDRATLDLEREGRGLRLRGPAVQGMAGAEAGTTGR